MWHVRPTGWRMLCETSNIRCCGYVNGEVGPCGALDGPGVTTKHPVLATADADDAAVPQHLRDVTDMFQFVSCTLSISLNSRHSRHRAKEC